MKIKWADGVDYVTVCEDRSGATVSMGGVSIAKAENYAGIKHGGVYVSVYAPAGTALSAMVAVVEWVFGNIDVLPTYGVFREYDPDGIETVGAPVEVV